MKTRLTIIYKTGAESSQVYSMAKSFKLAAEAEKSGAVKSWVLESERGS